MAFGADLAEIIRGVETGPHACPGFQRAGGSVGGLRGVVDDAGEDGGDEDDEEAEGGENAGEEVEEVEFG